MAISPAAMAMMMQANANPRAVLSQVVAEMAVDDPQMAMVSQYLALQPPDESDEDTASEPGAEPALEVKWMDDHEVMSLREEMASIQNTLEDQMQLIQELTDRNQELAAALGACPACWGEDDRCPDCRGHARPGTRKPDRRCFEYYVSPLLRRLQARKFPHRESGNGDSRT
jgi:hypothetical protein